MGIVRNGGRTTFNYWAYGPIIYADVKEVVLMVPRDANETNITHINVYKNEGICGMALPSVVNEKFLRENCDLNWGDAYLLQKEIKLKKRTHIKV